MVLELTTSSVGDGLCFPPVCALGFLVVGFLFRDKCIPVFACVDGSPGSFWLPLVTFLMKLQRNCVLMASTRGVLDEDTA